MEIKKLLYNNGYSDYELYMLIFLKHFKFLADVTPLGGYQISNYSWLAYERLIQMYSIDTKITIGFFEDGSSLRVYFEKKSFLFFKTRLWLEDIMSSKNLRLNTYQEITMDNIDRVFEDYANLFREHFMPIIKGEKWGIDK